jgi:hypothetical protein
MAMVSDIELPDAVEEVEDDDDDDRSVAPVSSRTRSVIRFSTGGAEAVEWRLVFIIFLSRLMCLVS